MNTLARLRAFLGPVVGSIKGSINFEEVIRVVYLAIASGAVTSVPQLLQVIFGDKDVLTASAPVFLSAGFAAALDLLRRLDHGAAAPSKP